MKERVSSVSPKGQVTIPAEIRQMLGVKPKDKVAFRVEKGEVKIVPAPSLLEASYRAIPALKRSVSLEEMERIAAEEAAQQAADEGR
jgi:AbrB family looped-hinge helix DNA binding protein